MVIICERSQTDYDDKGFYVKSLDLTTSFTKTAFIICKKLIMEYFKAFHSASIWYNIPSEGVMTKGGNGFMKGKLLGLLLGTSLVLAACGGNDEAIIRGHGVSW